MTSIIVTNRGPGDITRREDFTPDRLRSFGELRYVFIPFWSWYIPHGIYENWECVIFHMTDLPFGRGGSPLQNLIATGHKDTVISAIRCVKEIDAGPVYAKMPLMLDGTAEEIYDHADRIIRGMMIPFIERCNPEPRKQTGPVTYFQKWKCSKEDILRAMETDYESA